MVKDYGRCHPKTTCQAIDMSCYSSKSGFRHINIIQVLKGKYIHHVVWGQMTPLWSPLPSSNLWERSSCVCEGFPHKFKPSFFPCSDSNVALFFLDAGGPPLQTFHTWQDNGMREGTELGHPHLLMRCLWLHFNTKGSTNIKVVESRWLLHLQQKKVGG